MRDLLMYRSCLLVFWGAFLHLSWSEILDYGSCWLGFVCCSCMISVSGWAYLNVEMSLCHCFGIVWEELPIFKCLVEAGSEAVRSCVFFEEIYFFKYLFLFYVYPWVHVYVSRLCRGQWRPEKGLEPLELELKVAVSSPVGAGNWIWVLCNSSNALRNHCAITPAPNRAFYYGFDLLDLPSYYGCVQVFLS